jgi:tetratricopeptide (TPR) repeat protein
LICARPLWPSEFAAEADTGGGLTWVLLMLATLGLAIAGTWIGGATRLRLSRADAAVLALVLLVGLGASRAAERRVAVNLAWEWAGLGIAYVLVRNLPRTPRETSALAGVWAATAVAVAAYGLYQVGVEFPTMKANYLRNPDFYLAKLGIEANSPERKLLEDRLLGSKEPYGTFALANSLAGFLVGPAALACGVALGALPRRKGQGPAGWALAMAAVPGAALLLCLLLTKSRSAYLGLMVALLILAWRERRRFSAAKLAFIGMGAIAALAALVVVAAAAGQLDRQVLTESTKSLRYRWEYWVGGWGVIREQPWTGHGPGNFGGPYLRHKLPESSEEIADPHNMILDVWAAAGAFAAAALLAALGLGLRDIFGPPRGDAPTDRGRAGQSEAGGEPELAGDERRVVPGDPPRSSRWLVACAGGAWLLVVALGKLDPINEGDALIRWLALGAGWLMAVALGAPLWRRGPIPAVAAGAGAVAVAVNLLAAGGIGMPSVALGLWALLALGQDLRTDRPCGRLRDIGGRWGAFGLAAAWAALAGMFYAHISPFWRAEAELARAHQLERDPKATRHQIDAAYVLAGQSDELGARAWLALADFEYRAWMARGAPAAERVWPMIDWSLDEAAKLPRNPRSLGVQRLRARLAEAMLRHPNLPESEARILRQARMEALARASTLYPTNVRLHADLADALAALGQFALAAREGREALRLDALTPHADKKLHAAARKRLGEDVPRWESARDQGRKAPPAGKPAR